MIQLVPQLKILLACEPVDFRKGIDALAALCKSQLAQEPMSGAIFVFRNRSGTALKLLTYDGRGYWLQPVSDPVVAEEFERRAAAVAKDEEGTGERILLEFPLTDRRQAIDAIAKVYRFTGKQDSKLRDELDHSLSPRRKLAAS
jgi:hypothetical protein